MRFALVVPCYNEENRIESDQFLRFIDQNQNFDFFFVNDGSTDQTKEILSKIKILRPKRVNLINLDTNSGKAEATRAGVLKAYIQNYDYIGYWDADLATPLEQLLTLEKELRKEKLDFIIFGRKKTHNSDIRRNPIRHLLGRTIALFANFIHGLHVYDSQCGAKLFNRDTINVAFEKKFLTKWCFDVEILIRLRNENKTNFKELYPKIYLHKSGSKITFKDILQAPLDLIKIYINYSN